MLKINIITLFPELFSENLKHLPFKRAEENCVVEVNLINLRKYALDNYGTVDDKPYGGGAGMLLMIEPVYNALKDLFGADFEKKVQLPGKPLGRVIALSPRGKKFRQQTARTFSKEEQITLICGRYEGVDARIEEFLSTDIVSIGDYVLSGGELPALVIMEAVVRLLPDVLAKDEATAIESFSKAGKLEYSQYTRPENFRGMKVPPILLSGDHKKIKKWRNLD